MRFLADEHIDLAVIRGLQRRYSGLDITRVVEVGLGGKSDPEVLEWAAAEGRVLVTKDKATVPSYAFERVGEGLPMPGVIVASRDLAIGQLIEELSLYLECVTDEEMHGQVFYIP